MDFEFSRKSITEELIKDALDFFNELSQAVSENSVTTVGKSAIIKKHLKDGIDVKYQNIEYNLVQRLDETTHRRFQTLDEKVMILRHHLVKLRTAEEILTMKVKKFDDLLECLYAYIVHLCVVAFTSQIALLGGISLEELAELCSKDKDFLKIDFILLGDNLAKTGASLLISNEVAKSFKHDEQTLVMSFLNVIVSEMLINHQEVLESYTLALKAGGYSVVYAKAKDKDDSNTSKILREARDMFLELLKLPFETIQKLVKHYELLDISQDKADSIKENYLQQGSKNSKQTIMHLNLAFPKKVIVFPLKSWACMLLNGEICVSSLLISESYSVASTVKTMFVILHELAHLKKFIYLAQRDYLFETPESVKRITRIFEPGTTGELMEKNAFNGRVWIESIYADVALKLFNHLKNKSLEEHIWKEIEIQITTKPPEIGLEGLKSTMAKTKQASRCKRKCSTSDVVMNLTKFKACKKND